MSRNERKKQLAEAVRAYRGTFDPETKRWFAPPQPRALARVERLLTKLQVAVKENVTKIDGFKSTDEMAAWLAAL